MKRHIYYIFFLSLILGCSGIKESYGTDCIPLSEHVVKETLKKYNAEKENFVLLFFTENFVNDSIIISNKNTLVYRGNIETIEGLGLAAVIKIDNNLDTKIYNKSEGFSFIIKKNKYKFIYLRKTKTKKYDVVYSNTLCGFR